MRPKFIFPMISICILTACDRQAGSPEMPTPPDAEQRLHVVSAPAGERNDPYYWLRDDSRRDPDMLALLQAENEYTRAMLADQAPLIDELADEMRARIPGEQSEAPYFDDGFWYYTRYEKGGRLAESCRSQTEAQRRHCDQCEAAVERAVLHRRGLPPPLAP